MAQRLSDIINAHRVDPEGSGSIPIVIVETRDPESTDTALIGTMWINQVAKKFFICTDTVVGNTTWEIGGSGLPVRTDVRDPNVSDLGTLGQVWINTVKNKFFICSDATPGATVWDTDTQVIILQNPTNPTVTDDDYPVGTMWVNTVTRGIFHCTSNATGAAVWKTSIETIESSVDPTMSDYNYPLGSMWINGSDLNHKVLFILIDNTEDRAIWLKSETDIYWVTDPVISGSVTAECDETIYTYNASNSLSAIDEATTITYHWSCTGGVLSATTGNSVDVYFTNAEKSTTQILSCYAQDDLGYISKSTRYYVLVGAVNVASDLTLSLPNKIITTESTFFDITVGYTGGDHTLEYLWEASDNGTTWSSAVFVDETAKLSEAVFSSTGTKYVRCTVTNLGGDATETSAGIPCIAITSDADSTYLDTTIHNLENKVYPATMITANIVGVPTIVFEQNDRVIINGNQDNITDVNNVYDTQMNMVTDEVTINDDFTSFTTVCTLMGNKVIVACNNDDLTPNGVIRVGTFNGDTITFGEPVVFNSNYSQWIQVLPLVDNKVIVAYRNDGNNNLGGCKIGTVTGNTITYSSEFVFNSVDTDHISICKIDDSRFAIAYSDYGTGNLGTLVIGQVSGDNITFGTQQLYTNSAYYNTVTLVSSNKLVICYQDDLDSNHGKAVVASVSGTNIVLGTPVTFNSNGYTNYINVVQIAANKIAVTYQDGGTSGHGYVVIGDISGTAIVFGTPQAFETSSTTYISSKFSSDRLIISYKDASGVGKVNFGQVSGTVVVFTTPVTFNSSVDFIKAFPFDNKIAIVFKDLDDSNKGKLMVYTPYRQELTLETETVSGDTDITRLNTEYTLPIIAQQTLQSTFEKVVMEVQTLRNNKFGVVESAGKLIYDNYEIEPYVIGDRVLVDGDTNVFTTITDITRSVIAGDGSPVAGDEDVFSDSNTQQTGIVVLGDTAIVAFRDNSTTGAVMAGEIEYDNVYFFNKVTFNATDVSYVSIAKVTDNKAIICYKNVIDGKGKAFVAELIDGELSIGSVVQFSANVTDYIDVVQFGDGGFAIAYQDVTDSGRGKCIIGSVTGTVPSFGTPVVFSNSNTTFISITPVGASSVAITYRNVTNSGYGTIIVGGVTGTVPAFGTAQVFYSGSTTYNSIKTLATNKIVVKYTDYTSSNYGKVIAGTVSGTVVTFGTAATFNSNETYFSSIEVTEDNVFMIVYDNYVGARGYCRLCTVSGTAITLGSPVQVNDSTTSHIDVAKINNNKIVATYSDLGNSYKGTSQIIRRDFNKLRSTITIAGIIPTNVDTIELLPYKIEASTGDVQSFESTEYYHTDLNEIYSVVNDTTLLTTATIIDSGNYFYSRVLAINTDEFDKYITRIDIDFWTQS